MSEDYEEMCDVEVVLRDPNAIDELRRHGLTVTNVDRDDGVVEGTISANKLPELRQLDSVAQARIVFSYLVEPPPQNNADAAPNTSEGPARPFDRGAAPSWRLSKWRAST